MSHWQYTQTSSVPFTSTLPREESERIIRVSFWEAASNSLLKAKSEVVLEVESGEQQEQE